MVDGPGAERESGGGVGQRHEAIKSPVHRPDAHAEQLRDLLVGALPHEEQQQITVVI
jgi:hypothetical protein